MSDLKPCPFCGGKVEFDQYVGYSLDSSFDAIVCECGVYMRQFKESDREMIEKWNTRTADQQLTTLRQKNSELVELVEQSFIEGCKTGYSNGLNDGQSWSNWKTTNEPSAEWECSDSKQLLSKIKGEKDANRN
ncbi:TPA: Lar family restriction alleviation protein [Vibrio cholerae]